MKKFLYFFSIILLCSSMVYSATILVPTDYPTIQAAINAAGNGDEIIVAAGTYVENFSLSAALSVVNKSIKIIGAGSALTIVKMGVHTNGIVLNGTSAMTIWLEGMTFTPDGATGPGFFIRIGENSGPYTSVTLKDLIVEKAEGRNILLEQNGIYTNVLVENCIIRDSKLWGFSLNNPAVTANGITIINSDFTGNGTSTVVGDLKFGIGLDLINATNVSVTGGNFNSNASAGISLSKVSNSTFTSISAQNNGSPLLGDNQRNAVTITEWSGTNSSSNISFIYPTIANNTGRGLMFYTENPGNTITGVTVTGGYFDNNTAQDFLIYEALNNGSISGVSVNQSYFLGSYWFQSPNPVNFSGNWWGSNVPSTVRSIANGTVNDYTPWLNVGTDLSTDPGFQADKSIILVDDDSPQFGSVGRIQEAVGIAWPFGSTINVLAGTYEEQITVDNKSVIIDGAGVNSSFINSPATLAITFATSYNYRCIVGVINNGNLDLRSLTVDGLSRGNVNNRFTGVGFRNSGGTVQSCKILNIKDTPFSGVQHGVAIFSYNDDTTARTINVLANEITGFQKNAMALNASDTNPLTVNVTANTVTGAGATGVTAQNGIQVMGDIVTGNIQDNVLSGIGYLGASYVATTILNYYSDVDIVSNTVTNGHVGIYNIDGISNILNNNITAEKIGSFGYGIIATDPPQAVPSPFDIPEGESKVKNGPEALTSVLLDGNIVTFSGADNTATYGIEADAGYGPNDLAVLATNNTVSGFGVGFGVYECESGCLAGEFTSLDFNHNNILNNTIGFETNLATPVLAEYNWWGTTLEFEIQAMISGNLDYDPWLGKAVTVTQTTPVTYDFPGMGVKMVFSTLPTGGGNVTVLRYNEAYTPFPVGYSNVAMWLDITSTMPNYSFDVTVYVDVFGIAGFDATTIVMYRTSEGTWLAIPGGIYNPSDPMFGGHPSFSFVTNHFTPFTFINTPADAFNVYLSSGTSAASGFIYPNTDWEITGYEPPLGDDWDFTAPISLYIVPEVGSEFGASDITVQWDNTMYSFSGVDPSGGIYDNPAYQFFYNQLGTTNSVTINASRTDNNNFTIGTNNYIAKLNLNLLKPGFAPISFTALDFRAFDGGGGQLGVFVTGNNAQVKSYLGDVASHTSTLTGDGLIDFYDLSPWSICYWSGVGGFGMANYKVKYDVGPTSTNNVYGIPTVDGKIQFEDLVIFSMSYGFSAGNVYPKIEAEPTAPVDLQLGEPIIAGSQTRIPLFVSGGVQNVRAMSLTFVGQFGRLVSVEKGTLLTEFTNPVIVMSNVDGNQVYADLAVFGAEEVGINTAGEVLTLVFEGNTEININSADVRNILNGPMAVNISGSEGLVPSEFALMQNYPNPFNPTTTINYNLPKQAMVEISIFNALGEKVATVVNEIKDAGKHTVEFNAAGYSSGIYFYQIKANDFVSVKKMILMK